MASEAKRAPACSTCNFFVVDTDHPGAGHCHCLSADAVSRLSDADASELAGHCGHRLVWSVADCGRPVGCGCVTPLLFLASAALTALLLASAVQHAWTFIAAMM